MAASPSPSPSPPPSSPFDPSSIPKDAPIDVLHKLKFEDAKTLAEFDHCFRRRLQRRFEARESNLHTVHRAVEDILAVRNALFAFSHREYPDIEDQREKNDRWYADLIRELQCFLLARFGPGGINAERAEETHELMWLITKFELELKLGNTLVVTPGFINKKELDLAQVFSYLTIGTPDMAVIYLSSRFGGPYVKQVEPLLTTDDFFDIPHVFCVPYEVRDAMEAMSNYLLDRAGWSPDPVPNE